MFKPSLFRKGLPLNCVRLLYKPHWVIVLLQCLCRVIFCGKPSKTPCIAIVGRLELVLSTKYLVVPIIISYWSFGWKVVEILVRIRLLLVTLKHVKVHLASPIVFKQFTEVLYLSFSFSFSFLLVNSILTNPTEAVIVLTIPVKTVVSVKTKPK